MRNDGMDKIKKKEFLQSKYSVGNLISLVNRELEYYFNHIQYENDGKSFDEGISRMEGLYLLLLNSNPGITQYQIAEVFKADITLVAKFTRKLLNKGYVIKKDAVDDRRRKLLYLTERSQEIMPLLIEEYDLFNKSVFDNFTSEEYQDFNKLLTKMLNNVYLTNLEVRDIL